MKRKPRIAIMTPIRHGTVHADFAISLAATMRAITKWDLGWFTVTGNSILPDARSQCLAQALSWGADKLCFIDDDISWTVQDFVFLNSHPVKACTGYYMVRQNDGDETKSITIKLLDGTSDFPKTSDGGLLEIAGAGFGFIRFDREVFDVMELECKPMHDKGLSEDANRCYHDWFPYSLNWSEERKAYIRGGEDMHFCERIRQKGFPLYLDPKINLGHHAGAQCFRVDITQAA
jgi:hypothetical protein